MYMKLYELLKGVDVKGEMPQDTEIDLIISDTRIKITGRTLFICLKGARFDSHDSVAQLREQGVSVFVTERDCGVDNQIIVRDTRLALSQIWANSYCNPEREMKFIGVTGTERTRPGTLCRDTQYLLPHCHNCRTRFVGDACRRPGNMDRQY